MVDVTKRMAACDAAFQCDACRIWTGSRAVLLGAVVAAEERALEELPARIGVELSRRRRGMLLHRADVARALFVADDAIRMIDVYAPSPFTATVVVQVDIDDETQQCFFFSRVSSADTLELDTTPPLSIYDHLHMAAFLAALHRYLPDVPMATTARKLLADKQVAHSKATPSLKRRRASISPTDFYGRLQRPNPNTMSHGHSVAADDSWKAFYQRLQFNVSHSLLCQLEGTAALSASFPRQQEAFEFADQVVAFRKHLQQQQQQQRQLLHDLRNTPQTATRAAREADQPRVFCFEGANEGKRRFWVTTMDAFWSEYLAIPVGMRHVYEIIREGVPCRLYFDLEFKTELNPAVDGEALVTRLISLVQLQIYRKFRLLIRPEDHIVQLDSSTPAKFSRHLTIHFPNGELFEDNIHAGAFVRQFIHDLVDPHREGEESHFLVHDADGQKQLFIDIGVYTRNRMFRVLGSSKFRKTAVLRPHRATTDNPPDEINKDLFMRSIVCPFSSRDPSNTLLRCDESVTLKRYGGAITRSAVSTVRSVESKSSMYPALDAFVRSIAVMGGVQGEIRAVQLMYPKTIIELQDPSPAEEPGIEEPVRIVYHMMRNRWCENVGRSHKSNNVMFVVDLVRRVYFQRCHDPTCQSIEYRSPARSLPITVEMTSTEL